MKPTPRHWTALTILGASTATTGVSFVLFKASVLAQEPFAAGESSWFIAAHNLTPRFAVGVLGLLALYRGRVLQLTRLEWTQAVFMALVSFGGCLLQTDGLQRSTAATTAFLTQFYVILIPLWWALIRRRRPSGWVLLAAGLVLAGVAVLARVDWQAFRIGRGEAEILLATFFFSLLLCAINWPAFATNRAERTTAAMFLIECGLFAAVSVATCRVPRHLFTPYASPSWLGLGVVTAVLGTAGPFLLINRWQRFIPATEAGLLYSFSPVIAALTEVALPAVLSVWVGINYANQPLTLALVTGGALILGANVLIQLRSPSRE
jgi:drug/metabolite transporter (DMT)-like permease